MRVDVRPDSTARIPISDRLGSRTSKPQPRPSDTCGESATTAPRRFVLPSSLLAYFRSLAAACAPHLREVRALPTTSNLYTFTSTSD